MLFVGDSPNFPHFWGDLYLENGASDDFDFYNRPHLFLSVQSELNKFGLKYSVKVIENYTFRSYPSFHPFWGKNSLKIANLEKPTPDSCSAYSIYADYTIPPSVPKIELKILAQCNESVSIFFYLNSLSIHSQRNFASIDKIYKVFRCFCAMKVLFSNHRDV